MNKTGCIVNDANNETSSPILPASVKVHPSRRLERFFSKPLDAYYRTVEICMIHLRTTKPHPEAFKKKKNTQPDGE